jgi:tetratricopeptide (TPR) repeat protein
VLLQFEQHTGALTRTRIDNYAVQTIKGLEKAFDMSLDEAVLRYTAAINNGKDFAEAYFYRGYAFLRKGEKEKAEADFQRILDLPPQSFFLEDEEIKAITRSFLSFLRERRLSSDLQSN